MKTIKTFALLGLIILAGFQVSRLWFDNFTDRAVLQYFSAFFLSAFGGQHDTVIPLRSITADDDGRFFIQYGENNITSPITINYISVLNPYLNEIGQFNLSFIRNRVEGFFANPVTINHRVGVDGIFTYSSLNTMVRFLPWNVIEYSSFRPIRRGRASSGFNDDLSAAVHFISHDSFVINEFFLADYESRGGQHIFFFNFIVAGLPLNMPDIWPGLYESISAIKVVVDHGHVVSYRRIAYQFLVQDSYYFFDGLCHEFYFQLDYISGQAVVLFSCGG